MSELQNKLNSDSESDDEQILKDTNSNQTNKDKKKKKKNKSKTNNDKLQPNKPQPNKPQPNKPQSGMAKLILERKRLQEEEDERIKKLQEEENRKIKEEEDRITKIKKEEEEEKEKKRKAKQDKIQAQKIAGTYKTKSEKEKDKKNQFRLDQMRKLGIITDDGKLIMKQDNFVLNNLENNLEPELEHNNMYEQNKEINFRCPLFTIMGHVDTGKTTLLDYLRNTTVQSHEVGGITQQIGTTMLSKDIILKQLNQINKKDFDVKVPGLILIDTPGHEAFKGLRKLGSKLADIALVIIDIMHGLEPQTIESIKLLNESGIPFMFVLNKIDRLYGWDDKVCSMSIQEIICSQDSNTRDEFETRFKKIQTQIMEQGINNELVWLNYSHIDTINVIPISAKSGQGIPDLLNTIIEYSQKNLKTQIEWNNELECIVMEITNIEGYGYTLDSVIKNGQLTRGDIIKIQTQSDKYIFTKIKNILTVPNNNDSKSSSKYISNQSFNESGGIKIVAQDLEKTLIGSKIKIGTIEEYNNYIDSKFNNLEQTNLEQTYLDTIKLDTIKLDTIKLDTHGIAIYTSSQGSLESFVNFMRANTELPKPVQISNVFVGNVMKKDLVKLCLVNSSNTFLENNCVLLFEVDIDKEAIQYAKENNIMIFRDETIYRLFNQYKEYACKQYNIRKEIAKENTVFPCILKIIENNVFNKKNPLVMGVEIIEGSLHLGTPLIILPNKTVSGKTVIGKVVGIQINKQDISIGKQGQSVCIKIDNQSNQNITYGRHFDYKDLLYSNITRASVDLLKEYFKKDISKDDIGLLMKLKKLLEF
jgi:translation initiation factor 5B